MMKTRIISGVVAAIILVAVLFLGETYIKLAVSLLSIGAIYEIYKISVKNNVLKTAGFLYAVLFYISFFTNTFYSAELMIVFVVSLFVIYIVKNADVTFEECAKTFFVAFYVCQFFSYLIHIRAMQNGVYLIWLPILCAFLTDIFALVFGLSFGKHKLCPIVSPKKTVEGSIGGILGSIFGMAVFGFVVNKFFSLTPNYVALVITGAVVSVISQLGDLSASVIKRQYKIKDYGKIMPGHGGVMDRLDSVLFAAPAVYFILKYIPIFF